METGSIGYPFQLYRICGYNVNCVSGKCLVLVSPLGLQNEKSSEEDEEDNISSIKMYRTHKHNKDKSI